MIHVVGDSHANFFHGQPYSAERPWVEPWYAKKGPRRIDRPDGGFAVYGLGAKLAYNLDDCVGDIAEIVRENAKPGDALLLVLGEIDCRCHLVRRWWTYGSMESAVAAVCDHYIMSVLDVRDRCTYPVYVYGPVASTNIYSVSGTYYDTTGSEQERNILTRAMTNYLADLCKRRGLPFVSIFEHLVNVDMTGKRKYWIDSVHVGPEAWTFFLQEWEKVKPK
jgi:hypothetical protein